MKISTALISLTFILSSNVGIAQTIWNGPSMNFTKADGADWTLPANQDRITSNVWITRADTEGIFNFAVEGGYTDFLSPVDTEWAFGTTANISVIFDDWETTIGSNPPSSVNQDMILHLISDDIYIDIRFTSWATGMSGGLGGFSYVRSTDPSTGIEKTESSPLISVFPNPASDNIHLKGISSDEGISILDLQGRMICHLLPGEGGSFNISGLQKGAYFILSESGARTRFNKD